MYACKYEKCGRKFENENIMIEHIKRRHTELYDKMKKQKIQVIGQHQCIEKQINKLPKLIKLKDASKDNKSQEKRSKSKMKTIILNKSYKNETQQNIGLLSVSKKYLDKLPTLGMKAIKKNHLELMKTGMSWNERQQKGQLPQQKQLFYTTGTKFSKTFKKANNIHSKSKDKIIPSQSKDKIIPSQSKDRIIPSQSKDINTQNKNQTKQKIVTQPNQKPTNNKIALKRHLKSNHIQNQAYLDKVVVIQNIMKSIQIPKGSLIQTLFLSNCQLQTIDLNGLQSLRILYADKNHLQSTSFLSYTHNHNIQNVNLNHNEINYLSLLPPNLKSLSISFNNIQNLEQNSKQLSKCHKLEEVEFTFNPIRKQANYRVHLKAYCWSILKIDGIKCTKIDEDMAIQYRKILNEQKNIIPLQVSYFNSFKDSPYKQSTHDTTTQKRQQLNQQCIQLQQIIKYTQKQLQIISQQNIILQEEIKQISQKCQNHQQNYYEQYKTISQQCSILQFLNYMQFASKQELINIINKKQSLNSIK